MKNSSRQPEVRSEILLKWYYIHKRDLPWRKTRDPYLIWVSEIILQQTRVAQGLPYYLRFIDEFPNVKSLSKADSEKVMKLWQGLGYYNRALHMIIASKMVMDTFNGLFPSGYDDLIQLKGIGKYTAAAIASISVNEPVAAIDGNVIRVISRIFGIRDKDQKKFNSSIQTWQIKCFLRRSQEITIKP
jgi:A/G-specific adenine glycosylase